MEINNKERREIARKLRDIKRVDLGDGLVCPSCDLGEALDFDWANDDYIFEANVDKLAELIDRPTCKDSATEEWYFFCSECENAYSNLKPHFCPSCGAEVQE